MSKFHRGIKFSARRRARLLVKRFEGKDFDFVMKQFNLREFESKFGRVSDFEASLECRRWTFRTYIKRCVDVFGDADNGFYKQTRRHRQFIQNVAKSEVKKALAKKLGI
jgi:hypothetical protein